MKNLIKLIISIIVLYSLVTYGAEEEWIGGQPVQTDTTNYEWISGMPYIVTESPPPGGSVVPIIVNIQNN